MKQYVTFYSDNKMFGIDIRLVNEVNPSVSINPVPLSDSHIRGLVNIRGQVVMVIDIAVVFGNNPRPITDKSHIVILKTEQDLKRVDGLDKIYNPASFGNKPVGFLADMIGEVVVAAEEEIEPAPPHVEEKIARFIDGVIKLKEHLMIVIKPVKILWYKTENTGTISA